MKYFLFIAMICAIANAYAQDDWKGYDSIAITKPKKGKLLYEVNHPMFREISIKLSDPEVDKTAKGSVGGYIGRNFMASLLGNWNSSQKTNLLLPAQLKTEPDGFGWNVNTYVDGKLERSTERIRNSDGSRSTQTTKTVYMNWDNGAWGNIIDKTDTIGAFILSVDPLRDSTLTAAYNKIRDSLPETDARRNILKEIRDLGSMDFGLFGNFKESSFIILFAWERNGGYIYVNGNLDAVVYVDNEQPGEIFISKHKRFPPKLLVRKELTEGQRADMIRMALLCKLFAQATSRSSYNY